MRFKTFRGLYSLKYVFLRLAEKYTLAALGLTLGAILAVSYMLYWFPPVQGERWLLAVDVVIVAGLFLFLGLDIVRIKRELEDWLNALPISAYDKIWLRHMLFNAYSMSQVADVARLAIKLENKEREPSIVVENINISPQQLAQIRERAKPERPMRKKLSCPHCGSEDVLVDGGYLYCLSCGRVSRVEA